MNFNVLRLSVYFQDFKRDAKRSNYVCIPTVEQNYTKSYDAIKLMQFTSIALQFNAGQILC